MKGLRRYFFSTILLSVVAFGVLDKAEAQDIKWKEWRAAHFLIYYKAAPEAFLQNVEDAAERYYDDITKDLGYRRHQSWSWDERAKIYIYDDNEDYYKHARQARWSHGVASPKDKVIRTFPSAHGFFDSTLPHELGHIIFREFIGFRSKIPLWFEEGVAMYQEQAKRWGSRKVVQDAIKNNTFLDLMALSAVPLNSRTNKSIVNLFYAESASIVYEMITELGQQRFVLLCRKLQEGLTFELALTKAYARFDNIEELNKWWKKRLKQ